MLSYAAFFPSHVCWLQYDLTQLLSWRANSTASLIWSCQLVHVSLFGAVPVHLLATALMHVPRCWLLAKLSLLTSAPSLFISSRLFTLNLFPASYTLLVSEIFIYVACMHVNWLQNDVCNFLFDAAFVRTVVTWVKSAAVVFWASLFQLHFPRQVCSYMHPVSSIWCTSSLRSCCLDQVILSVWCVGTLPPLSSCACGMYPRARRRCRTWVTPAPITWNILTGIRLLWLGATGNK